MIFTYKSNSLRHSRSIIIVSIFIRLYFLGTIQSNGCMCVCLMSELNTRKPRKMFKPSYLCVLIVWSLIPSIWTQINDAKTKCPQYWVQQEKSCYKFVKGEPVPRSEARRNCQVSFWIRTILLSIYLPV